MYYAYPFPLLILLHGRDDFVFGGVQNQQTVSSKKSGVTVSGWVPDEGFVRRGRVNRSKARTGR